MDGIRGRQRSEGRKVGRGMTILGSVCCIGSVAFVAWSAWVWAGASSADGIVTGYTGGRGPGTGIAPVVGYEVAGVHYRCTGPGLRFGVHRIGAKIGVLYQKEHPEIGQLSSFMDRWFLPLFFFCCGGFIFLLGRLITAGVGGARP